jgi:hypothetical protein
VANAARKTTNFANQTVETARIDVLKEPLGFVKILQFVLALLAFAIACNGSSAVFISVQCQLTSSNLTTASTPASLKTQLYKASYGYPYDLTDAKLFATTSCPSGQKPKTLDQSTICTETHNIVSSAQFFVFVGVMSFLYSFAFIIIYVFFRHKYNNIVYFPLVDFGFTVIFALFWFCGSIAWAKAVDDIQSYTNPEKIITNQKLACPPDACYPSYYPTYANIIVAAIIGFGNLVLWIGDVWFVLKETSWFKTRRNLRQAQSQQVNNPIQSTATNANPVSIGDISISARYNPNDKI